MTHPHGRERLTLDAALSGHRPGQVPRGLAIPPLALAVRAVGIAAGSGPGSTRESRAAQ